MSKHLRVLERAGLIARGRSAQLRPSRLQAQALKEVADWVADYRGHWGESFDRLTEHLEDVQRLKRYGSMPGIEFQAGNLTVAVIEIEKFGQPFTVSRSAIMFQVDDVPATREELEGKGVDFSGDIIDSGACHQAFFSDPDGNTMGLHHRYAT